MQKESELAFPADLTELLAKVEKMEIVHPHDVSRLQECAEAFGKSAVDAPICSVQVPSDNYPAGKVVKQRPKGAVGPPDPTARSICHARTSEGTTRSFFSRRGQKRAIA